MYVLISVNKFIEQLTHVGIFVVAEDSAANNKLFPQEACVLMGTLLVNMKNKACDVLVITAKEKNKAGK